MFEQYKKESPIISLLGMGGGVGSYIFTAPDTGYEIARSLRFNSADSAYLSRTPASAGNRKTWTWAGWVKLAAFADSQPHIFGTDDDDNNRSGLLFATNNELQFYSRTSGVTDINASTLAVFRDYSAWYHIVLAVDTTQAVAADVTTIYVNGIEQALTVSAGVQDALTQINSNVEHTLGRRLRFSDRYLDGYLADIHFIDGQALDPTSFGEFDADTGVWNPIQYTGEYGTNGFHLPFSDNSTAAALGTDTSGNGNDWTVNNLEAAGTTVYSDNVTINGTVVAGTPRNIFDGLTSTGYIFLNNGGGAYIEVTFSPSLSASSKFEFYWSADSLSSYGYSLNGGSTVSIGTSTGKWEDLGAVGAVSSIKLIQVSGRTDIGGGNLRAIRLNGNILVDPGFEDSSVDVPTNGTETDTGVGGEVRGNYCKLNPLNKSSIITLSNGNLDFASTDSANRGICTGTIGVVTGKWYYEVTVGTERVSLGYVEPSAPLGETVGYSAGSYGYNWTGVKINNNVGSSYGATFTTGDVIGVAVDLDAGNITFYKNGASQGTAFTGLSGTLFPAISDGSSGGGASGSINFGQRPFVYTAPSGYKALCTANLPTPTIEKGSDYFDTKLYTGNGSTQTISGLDFSPDLVWIKNRAAADSHKLTDTVRGATEELESDTTAAEATNADGLTAFNSDGFDLGADAEYNTNTETYVAWTWDAGSSTVTNTDGSITSSVRANASAGFSIVTYTGNGTNDSTVGHGLGAKPALTITKNRSSVANWIVYTDIIDGSLDFLFLDSTNAKTDSGAIIPTTTVVYRGSALSNNTLGEDYVMYCFAPVDGYSSFGSYTGNGSATDGPFVYTGFRPAWIMYKNASAAHSWVIFDSTRDTYNVSDSYLLANSSAAEADADTIDFLSNGFKLRSSAASPNGSGNTIIYIAFAENPFALNARAR